eukprot:TRINITY_DN571_c0_g1_i6.p1 TRINITY_DN571_c0_g1~~TRINITY_DN571_c0_g1_i6.p1  ORF type:complete len:651 (+),score=146.63 TRINITY_DN571_c0_g1_i6:264-2216(+)
MAASMSGVARLSLAAPKSSLLSPSQSPLSVSSSSSSKNTCPLCCRTFPSSSSPNAVSHSAKAALRGVEGFNGLRRLASYPGAYQSVAVAAPAGFDQIARQIDQLPALQRWVSRGPVTCEAGMKLVFTSAEVAPWSKTGGLGDVLGGLPPALAARGHRVMTISPRYDQYKDAWDTEVAVDVKMGDQVETVRFFHCHKRGVDRVFIDHPSFLSKVWGKTGSKIYGETTGVDYTDNQLRFSLFNQAAIEATRVLSLNNNPYFQGPYGEDVIFIANDWHSALLPCYLRSVYRPRGEFMDAKVAFCVHNIAYQGRFPPGDFDVLNLGEELRPSFNFWDGYAKPVVGAKINWMKAGFEESDMLLTVSPNYAAELVSGDDKGVELNDVVERKGITGIVNGMDVQEWDPSADRYLDINYDISNVLEVKPGLKELLQAEVGLPVRADVPLFAFIGRLEEQKGSDLLCAAVPELMQEDLQLVVLGTGKRKFETELESLENEFPDKFRAVCKFNVPLAHLITAGADFMVVPSRFEPCGLIQLHAMRYGTVPIVAATGGLVDTVREGITGFRMGNSGFNVRCDRIDPADVTKVVTGVKRATKVYGTPALESMILAAMAQDLSWKEPARKWEEALLKLQVVNSKPGFDAEEIAPKALENIATP